MAAGEWALVDVMGPKVSIITFQRPYLKPLLVCPRVTSIDKSYCTSLAPPPDDDGGSGSNPDSRG